MIKYSNAYGTGQVHPCISIKRALGKFLISLLLLCCGFITVDAQEVLKRKNIDNLTKGELDAYLHAVQVLMDRSQKNKYVKEGYTWQAWVHNKNRVDLPDSTPAYPGMCEHGKDIFLMWHRAEFYYFEKVLQNADPGGTITDSRGNKGPSTGNVTVPYWNFSRKPTGQRYPMAFEDENSPLYHGNRNKGAVLYPFTSRYLVAHQLYNLNWPQYGGYPDATKGGYGNFESMIHNPMHSTYIGGSMGRPSTAAYDPIFYSFHAYIDLLLEKWIELHGAKSITSLDYYLRGDLPDRYNLPDYKPGSGDRPTMGQCKLYTDSKKLGYKYEILPNDEFVSKDELDRLLKGADGKYPVFGKSPESLFYLLCTAEGDFYPAIKRANAETNDYSINKSIINGEQDYRYTTSFSGSFQVDVYIHPKDVPFDVTSEPFRKKYLANLGVYWSLQSHDHHDNHDSDSQVMLNVNITDAARDLYKHFKGQTWQVSVNRTNL